MGYLSLILATTQYSIPKKRCRKQTAMDNLTGQILGKYKLFARLGKGGMARVYKAYQANLDRYVAVKVMHSHLAEEAEFVSRFEREASAVAHLRHPHIVQVFDFDNEHNTYFMVMEFIEGPTLKAELDERSLRATPFTLAEITSIITDIANAVDYAHERGMIHRDIKPANVLFTNDGQAILTDFGIVRMRGTPSYTMTGMIAGTPAYMSPEQAQSLESDARSDIYSIGVILYEMIIGKQPFANDNSFQVLQKHIQETVTFPLHTNIPLTPELEAVILQALAKNPDDRYQHGQDLAVALRQAADLDIEGLGSVVVEIVAVPPIADDAPFTPVRTSVSGRVLCPYQGLSSFNEENASFFYGRESFTEQLVTAVNSKAMTAVIGPSGSGKSSVIFAGLLPQLRQEERWIIGIMRPKDDPFQALAAILLPQLEAEKTTTDQLKEIRQFAQALRNKEIQLTDAIERILSNHAQAQKFLLVIDQFEEIYTLCADEQTRNAFLDILLIAVERKQIQSNATFNLMITLRTDFLGQALQHREFANALQSADIKLGPMTRRELSRAIANPARRQGKLFEKGLVAHILDDVGNEPGNLPLLEFALTELWQKTKHGRLSQASYEQIGKVEGALARYADKVFNELTVAEQEQAHRIFIQMVRPGAGTEDTRRLATQTELGRDNWQLVQKLADKRLVVTNQNPNGEESVEVVHEALIRGWQQLRIWMKEDRTFRDWQERLRAAMNQWQKIERDQSALLRGTLLGEAEKWLAEREEYLSREEMLYIEQSLNLQQAQEEKREEARIEREKAIATERHAQRITRLAAALGVAIVIMFILAGISLFSGQQAIASAREAEKNAQTAFAAQETAVFSQQEAIIARETAVADAQLRTTAEAEARTQQQLAEANAQEAEAAKATVEAINNELEKTTDDAVAAQETAEADERLARSRELAFTANSQVENAPSLALLLALEAVNIVLPFDQEKIPPITESVMHDTLQGLQLRRVLSSHEDEVTDVAVSPTQNSFATVSADRNIKIWDATTGREIMTLPQGHGRAINTVAYHPTKNILATGGDDGFVILWDLDTGTSITVLPQGTANAVREVAFNADGSQIAVATEDNLLHLWDTESRLPIEVLDGHDAPLTDVAYSPDGRFLASSSEDGSLILRDANSYTIIQAINPTFSGEPEDAQLMATTLVFSPDSNTLAAAFANGIILTWETENWQEISTLFGHANRINELAFSPDSTLLGSASNDGTAKVYDVSNAQALFTLSGHTGDVSSIAFTPDGETIITTSKDGTARLWNDEAGLTPQILTGHRNSVLALAFAPTSNKLASADSDGVVYIWDGVTNRNERTLAQHEGAINDLAFNPADETMLATVGEDGNGRLWDLNTGEVLLPILPHPTAISAVAFDPSGATLFTGSKDGLVRIWDVQTHELLRTFANDEVPIRDIAISTDGTLLAIALENSQTVLWKIATQQIIYTLAEHTEAVNAVAFSPDDLYLATGSEDGTAKMWDVQSGTVIRTFTGHGGPVTDVAFHPDADRNRLATSSVDGTMKLWDTTEGLVVRNFTGHTGAVNTAVFNMDGELLATASSDRTIRINDFDPIAQLFARGLTLAPRALTAEECAQYVRTDNCLAIEE